MKRTDGTYEIAHHSFYVKNIVDSNYSHKPTIVFLHDALGSAESWNTFPSEVCRSLELNGLLYDRLGYGRSAAYYGSWQKGYMEVEAFEILPQILSHFHLRNPILLGISDGGSIALLYASRHSQLTALISIAGHIMVEEKTKNAIAVTAKEPLNSKLAAGLQKYHGNQTSSLLTRWQSTWLSEGFATWDITDCLAQIKVPSLVMQGEEDQYASSQQCYDIGLGIGSSATAKIIKGCGHFPTKEKPQETIELIDKFLRPLL